MEEREKKREREKRETEREEHREERILNYTKLEWSWTRTKNERVVVLLQKKERMYLSDTCTLKLEEASSSREKGGRLERISLEFLFFTLTWFGGFKKKMIFYLFLWLAFFRSVQVTSERKRRAHTHTQQQQPRNKQTNKKNNNKENREERKNKKRQTERRDTHTEEKKQKKRKERWKTKPKMRTRGTLRTGTS